MNDDTKQALRSFMTAHFLCTIATVGENARPEAACVAYISNEAHEIIIGTSSQSRKHRNLSQNTAVALVIADTEGEVQYEGTAEILSAEAYQALFEAGSFPKLPGFDKYRSDPTQVYLKVSPSWMRFIVHGETDQITEFTEFA